MHLASRRNRKSDLADSDLHESGELPLIAGCDFSFIRRPTVLPSRRVEDELPLGTGPPRGSV
jgi:hypothetical protein